jgi:hypothetical protein
LFSVAFAEAIGRGGTPIPSWVGTFLRQVSGVFRRSMGCDDRTLGVRLRQRSVKTLRRGFVRCSDTVFGIAANILNQYFLHTPQTTTPFFG